MEAVTPAEVVSVPIAALARTTTGTDRAKNIVVLGLFAGWFGLDSAAILAGVRKRFEKKGAS